MATVGDGFKVGVGVILALLFIPIATCVGCTMCAGGLAAAGASKAPVVAPAPPATTPIVDPVPAKSSRHVR